MLLRFKEDRRTLTYMAIMTIAFVLQWTVVGFNPCLYLGYLFLSVAVTVIAHNHNHVPIFRRPLFNTATDYWLTVFYGFPSFAWIPTHNLNHHRLNNREGDYTITYRITESNTLLMLLCYPVMSSYFQQRPIRDHLSSLWKGDRRKWALAAGQYLALFAWIGAFLILDWRKALLYVVVPQQVGLFAVLVFNYVQHVHADEQSVWNHSRNFTGWLNAAFFNNGYHTVHHERAGSHWSRAPQRHASVAANIDPSLLEKSFWWYIVRAYFLAPWMPKFRTKSMRLARIQNG